MPLQSEIHQQPVCLERLLRSQRSAVERVAAAIRQRGVQYAFLAAPSRFTETY